MITLTASEEARRLAALRQYAVLDTLPEQSLDELTALGAQICEAPIALIALVDEHRQWFKSKVGLEAAETPRAVSFCAHTLHQPELFIVPDATRDARFAQNPLVTGEPGIRFYAGAPLVTPEGAVLGTLCVIDRVPRTLTPAQEQTLRVLARQVMTQLELRRQTRELAASETLLRTIIESEPECVKMLGPDGTLRLMNPAGVQMVEADSFEQIANQCVYPLVAEEQRAAFRELTAQVFRGESGTLEFQITGLKGARLWLETHATPLRDAAGEIVSLLGITRDITARKEAEAALRESEAQYRTLIERMGEGLIQVDDGDIIQFVNPRVCQMFGYSEAEMLGQHAATLLNREAERNRQRTHGIAEGYEIELRKKSGEFLRVWNSATPITTADGRCSGSMAIITDITARKQNEALLSGQNQVLEMIAAGAPLVETLTALLIFIESQSPEMLCSVLLLDAGGAHLRHGAAPSLPEAFTRAIDGVAIGANVGSCGAAAFRREPVVVADIASDPLWADYRELALAHGLRACWSTPIFDAQKKVLGTFAIYYRQPGRPTAQHQRLIDIATQTAAIAISRQRAEAEAWLLTQRLKLATDAASIGIWDWDLNSDQWYASATYFTMLGYDLAEGFSDRNVWLQRLHPDDQAAVGERIRAALAGSLTSYNYEARMRHADGSYRWIHVIGRVLAVGEQGQARRLLGVRMDITERKEAEQKTLAQLDELRRWQDVTLGREDRVLELKREVNELHRRLGEPARYGSPTPP